MTLSMALSLRVSICKMGHWLVFPSALQWDRWAVDIQMLEEIFQHRGPEQETSPLPTLAGPELYFMGEQASEMATLRLPWGLNTMS